MLSDSWSEQFWQKKIEDEADKGLWDPVWLDIQREVDEDLRRQDNHHQKHLVNIPEESDLDRAARKRSPSATVRWRAGIGWEFLPEYLHLVKNSGPWLVDGLHCISANERTDPRAGFPVIPVKHNPNPPARTASTLRSKNYTAITDRRMFQSDPTHSGATRPVHVRIRGTGKNARRYENPSKCRVEHVVIGGRTIAKTVGRFVTVFEKERADLLMNIEKKLNSRHSARTVWCVARGPVRPQPDGQWRISTTGNYSPFAVPQKTLNNIDRNRNNALSLIQDRMKRRADNLDTEAATIQALLQELLSAAVTIAESDAREYVAATGAVADPPASELIGEDVWTFIKATWMIPLFTPEEKALIEASIHGAVQRAMCHRNGIPSMLDQMSRKQKYNYFLKRNNLKPADFCRYVGVQRSALARWLKNSSPDSSVTSRRIESRMIEGLNVPPGLAVSV